MRRAAAAAGLALAWLGACASQPVSSEPVRDTTDSGLAAFGEDGFQCPEPVTAQTCCGVPGCSSSWEVAASCETTAAQPPGSYTLDSASCEGLLEARLGTTYALFDATSGALVALLAGPGPGSDGFSCMKGPVALAVGNECLAAWQAASASSPCTDAGALPSADAGCAFDASTD